MPNLYIIAGPNGVGKTTFVKKYLPARMRGGEFLNADMIAAGISPFDPAKAAVAAGRILLNRLRELGSKGADFSLETTLTGRTYFAMLNELKAAGYEISLDFLWVPALAITEERVRRRVVQGGHEIPADVHQRRFGRGLELLIEFYRPVLRDWRLIDNSGLSPHIISQEYAGEFRVFDFTVLAEVEAQSRLQIMEMMSRDRVEETAIAEPEEDNKAVMRAAWLAYADAILDGQRYQTTIVQWRKDRGVVFIPPELLVPLARRIIEVDGRPLADAELRALNETAERYLADRK